MTKILIGGICERVRFGRRWYRCKASYDAVLRVQELFRDEALDQRDKVSLAVMELVKSPAARLLTAAEQVLLLQQVYDTQVKVPPRPQISRRGNIRVLDFGQDAEYIYASFLQAYGLDLIEQRGKLHWKKFFALFEGLPDDTKIRQIMRIRSAEPPRPNKYNQEEIRSLMELKSYYALPVIGGGGEQGVDQLFAALERLAGS